MVYTDRDIVCVLLLCQKGSSSKGSYYPALSKQTHLISLTMADIDVEAVLKKLTLAEKVELLAGELYTHNAFFFHYCCMLVHDNCHRAPPLDDNLT